MKTTFEEAVARERFNGKALYRTLKVVLDREPGLAAGYTALATRLPAEDVDHAFLGIVRACFLIEPVKTPKIETTKFEVRWSRTQLEEGDPRFAPYEECRNAAVLAARDLHAAIDDPANVELLQSIRNFSLLPYEVPLDYIERPEDGPIHQAENIGWFWGDSVAKTIALRRALLQPSNPFSRVFGLAYDKLKVKTYLTDRVLTGDHKTNREKRWEVHPRSVHFALRRECLAIERVLMEDLCHFEGFPPDQFDSLLGAGLINTRPDVTRCPVTLEPLSFEEFCAEINDPDHGKSSFQVGHMNPLKAVSGVPDSGHTAQNIGWVTADGNRIQGHLSLAETRKLILRINSNYAEVAQRAPLVEGESAPKQPVR